MQKCLSLNLLQPTKAKQRLLKETYRTFFRMVEELLPLARRAKRRAQLQRESYENLRSRYGVASQLVLEAIFHAWSHRKTINGKCIGALSASTRDFSASVKLGVETR